MQCNAMPCIAVQRTAMQCNAMQCNAMQMQCDAMQSNAFQSRSREELNGAPRTSVSVLRLSRICLSTWTHSQGLSRARRALASILSLWTWPLRVGLVCDFYPPNIHHIVAQGPPKTKKANVISNVVVWCSWILIDFHSAHLNLQRAWRERGRPRQQLHDRVEA